MIRNLFRWSVITVAALLAVCTDSSVTGNPGGTEVTNGMVVSMSGRPVSGLTVTAYPQSYIEGVSGMGQKISAVTNIDGSFSLELDSGVYNLFTVDSQAQSGKYLIGILAKQQLGVLRLEALGAAEGDIVIDTSDTVRSYYLYSQGTPVHGIVTTNDSMFHIGYLPPGKYMLGLMEPPNISVCDSGTKCVKPIISVILTLDVSIYPSVTTWANLPIR